MLQIYSIAQNQSQLRETKDRHIGIILLPFRISVCINARAKLHHRVEIGQTAAEIWRFFHRFFKMAAAAILDLQNFKFLRVGRLKRAEMRRHSKCGQNRSNRGQNIAVFLSRRRPPPPWALKFLTFCRLESSRGSNCGHHVKFCRKWSERGRDTAIIRLPRWRPQPSWIFNFLEF